MKKDKKVKHIADSELWIQKIVERGIDELGRKVVRTKWFLAEGEVSLGSLQKRNTDIVQIRYKMPQEESFLGSLFK